MKKKNLLLLVMVALAALMLCGCGSFKKEVTEEEADKILEGKVEVPETLFKTQEEVEALFESVGLVPKFVVRNFDNTALNYGHYLRTGECDEMDDFTNAKYYDDDEVGDRYGVYADAGATIVIGYSDHDFDGTSGKAEEEDANEDASEESAETEEAEDASGDSSGIPEDILKQVQELNDKYDKLIEKAQGYTNAPETYTLSSYTEFMADYTDILTDYGKLSESMENYEDSLSSWEGYDVWMSILSKSTQLTAAISELPSDFAN